MTIWVITAAKLAVPATLSPPAPSSMWCVSIVPLTIRNRPPPASTMSRQDTSKSPIAKIGRVSPIIQVRLSSRRMRASSARPRPIRRAVAC